MLLPPLAPEDIPVPSGVFFFRFAFHPQVAKMEADAKPCSGKADVNQWLEAHRTLVLAAVGLLIAAAGLIFALRWQAPAPIVIESPPPSMTPLPTATSGPMQVYISGAVAHPDVYTLPPDAIVRDAVEAAGGFTADADRDRINLAQHLSDGEHIHIPRLGEAPTPAPQISEGTPLPSGPIDINTATQAELETLPGIGPALAQRIIEYREEHGPFASIEQIQNVSGIGPAKFEAIKDLITVGQ